MNFFFLVFLGFAEVINETTDSKKEGDYSMQGNALNDTNEVEEYAKGMMHYYEQEHYMEERRYDEKGNILCGPNTVKIENNCICNDSFVHGNPFSKEGCFNCPTNCSAYSTCMYPGECMCNYDYVGDGYKCVLQKPSINGIKEDNDLLYINIEYPSDGTIEGGFCRFGSVTTNAVSANNTFFICKIPISIPNEPIPLMVSIDGSAWSDDSIRYEKQSTTVPKDNTFKGKILIIIFIISMVLITLLLSNAKPVKVDEVEPFIKEKPRKPRRMVIV